MGETQVGLVVGPDGVNFSLRSKSPGRNYVIYLRFQSLPLGRVRSWLSGK